MTKSTIKITSSNCQGLRDIKKRFDVLNFLNNMGSDIICLQDTHWLTEDKKNIKKQWSGECFLNGTKTNSRGVAILISKNFEYYVSSVKTDDLGNYISILLTLSDLKIRLVNIYAPNSDTHTVF